MAEGTGLDGSREGERWGIVEPLEKRLQPAELGRASRAAIGHAAMLTVTRRGPARSRLLDGTRGWSVLAVTALLAGCYGLWTAATLRHEPRGFSPSGTRPVRREHAPPRTR